MRVGRNDPCPCGSGKKYKACCLEPDRKSRGAAQTLTPELRALAAAAGAWQADIVPVPAGLRDDPAARPGTALVMADEVAVYVEVLPRPSPEPEEVARTLMTGLLAGRERVGTLPPAVEVRHEEVAEALREPLVEHGVSVKCVPRLASVEEFAVGFAASLGSPGGWPIPSGSEVWAGWGLPEEWIASLFAAAAAYYRAAPWVWLESERIIAAEMPDGHAWFPQVLGHAGQEFGLAVYERGDDLLHGLLASEVEEAFRHLAGRLLSLTYNRRDELPRPMQREVASAGWPVAAPEAYPVLMVMSTPAGGLTRRDAADLVALLEAIGRFVAEHGEALAAGDAVRWRDPETGIQLSHAEQGRASAVGAPPDRLTPGGPRGPGAEPEAALRPLGEDDAEVEAELAVVERFAEWLSRSGLSQATVSKHEINANTFVDFLVRWQGVPVRAVHEYDLRFFLYDWYPGKVMDAVTRARAMPTSLRRFFEFLATEEGIECPWARDILRDRETYEGRYDDFPDGFWWDSQVQRWRSELSEDLDARALIHDQGLGTTDVWGETMGEVEYGLVRELQRRWLIWRDEVIAGGVTAAPEVRAALVARQREWETSGHPDLRGRSPVEAILAERETIPRV